MPSTVHPTPRPPGPATCLKDVVDELRDLDRRLEHVAITTWAAVQPPLEQQLGPFVTDRLVDRLVGAIYEITLALSMVERASERLS